MRGASFPGSSVAPGSVYSPGNGNGHQSVAGSVAEFGNNVANLVELQAKLADLDFQESVKRATVPLAVIVVGGVVVLASVPVALLGVADLLARALGIAPGWTMLLTAGVTAGVSGVILYLSVQEFARSFEPFRRSREEFVRNVAWLRTVLVHSGRSSGRRGT